MLNLEDEPKLFYDTAWKQHINRTYNLRITYPKENILLFNKLEILIFFQFDQKWELKGKIFNL